MYRFMNLRLSVARLAVAIFCAGTLTAQANLIENGSFESPDAGGVSQWISGTALTDWTISGNAVLLIAADWASAEDGVQYLGLYNSSSTVGLVQQTFSTEIGTTYDASFYYSLLKCDISGQVTYDVGGTPTTISIAANTPWTKETFQFTATSATTTLSFSGVATTGTGLPNPGVDNVVVTAVPEPTTMVLLLSAAAGLLAYAWRKRR